MDKWVGSLHRRMLILQDSTQRRGGARFKNLLHAVQMVKQYSPSLNTHPKWNEVVEDLKEGDIMLVLDP